jgi:uncharacterized membrane protein (GlpM family)
VGHEVLVLAAKGLAGGALVAGFALLSEGLGPKRFAGLFGAAPAVALTGMTIILIDKGHHSLHENGVGMIAGGIGMSAYAATTVSLLKRGSARAAAAGGLLVWVIVGAIIATPLLLA